MEPVISSVVTMRDTLNALILYAYVLMERVPVPESVLNQLSLSGVIKILVVLVASGAVRSGEIQSAMQNLDVLVQKASVL